MLAGAARAGSAPAPAPAGAPPGAPACRPRRRCSAAAAAAAIAARGITSAWRNALDNRACKSPLQPARGTMSGMHSPGAR